MSLLLDALKKAAQDKQKAHEGVTPEGAEAAAHTVAVSHEAPPPRQAETREPQSPVDEAAPEELHLPEDHAAPTAHAPAAPPEPAPEVPHAFRDSTTVTATPSTVTDDALRLLINRTNREYRRSQLTLWSGVIAVVIVVLSAGGIYFYLEMNSEMETMALKHRNELAALQSKTRIEETLTTLAEEVQTPKQKGETGDIKDAVPAPKVAKPAARNTQARPEKAAAITIERSRKEDPVSGLLARGWRAYQYKDYQTAREAYAEVLKREPNNQDALLGVAAVAIQQKDFILAREQYIHMLELDPRDPQAHAGLANLAQQVGGSLDESKIRQLIEHRPNDAHLQYTLGNLYVKKKDWPNAQAAYFRAWEIDSLNPDYAFNLAVSLDQLGKQREAAGYYRDSLRLAEGKNISFSINEVKQRLQQIQGRE